MSLLEIKNLHASAGEKPIPGVSSKQLHILLKKKGIPSAVLNGNADISRYLHPDCIFLTLGAGDVWKIGQKLFKPH